MQTDATLISNVPLQSDYHRLDLCVPGIAKEATPGQFVHVQLPGLEHRVLRRPFSICDTDPATGRLTIVYKVVGEGTAHLATIEHPGTVFNLLGPLGHGFTVPAAEEPAVIVAGGYGCAATFMLAKAAAKKPIVLIGARSQDDVLLVKEYTELGCDVRIATNDGSQGKTGFVTALLDDVLKTAKQPPRIAACGPNPMLKAVAEMALPYGCQTEISLDHAMCCGVGACFACVVKVKTDNPDNPWRYSRSCQEGPVYNATDIYWD